MELLKATNEHYKTPAALKAALTRAFFFVDYYLPDGKFYNFYFSRKLKDKEIIDIRRKFGQRLKQLFIIPLRHTRGHTVTCLIAEL